MLKNVVSTVLSEAQGSNGDGKGLSDVILYVIIGVVVVAIVGMLIFTNISRKKQAKKNEEQRSSLVPGDIIETVGGIIGTIVSIRNSAAGREFIIETGDDDRKTTLTVDVQALYRIIWQKNPPASVTGKDADGKKNADIVNADVSKPEGSEEKKDK